MGLIKYKDIPKIKKSLMKSQRNLCPICNRNFKDMPSKEICLDHNHTTGRIRAVLCRGCNSMEGKVYRMFVRMGLRNKNVNYVDFLEGLALYTFQPETIYIHPKHRGKI